MIQTIILVFVTSLILAALYLFGYMTPPKWLRIILGVQMILLSLASLATLIQTL